MNVIPSISVLRCLYFNALKTLRSLKLSNCNCHPDLGVGNSVRQLKLIEPKPHILSTVLITKDWQKSNQGSKVLMISIGLSFLGWWKEKDKESELITTIKRSVLLIQKEEPRKAEQMLHLALKLAQEQQNHEAIVYINDMMANLAYEQQELDKAEKLFVSVMQNLLSDGAAQNDNRMTHISLKLAHIYQMKKDIRKANEGFKFCLKNLQKKIDQGNVDEDTNFLWAMCLDWYARFLMEQKQFQEALYYFEKAYTLSLQVNGLEHEETVLLLNDLGTACFETEDVDGALNYLTKAYEIGKKLPNMEDFAAILVNLGNLYMTKGMYTEAKDLFDAALKNAKKHNNMDTLREIHSCLNELKVKIAA